MATVVFLSAPAYGHINPTLPLTAELVRRGERVVYYALEEFQPVIERTGAIFRSYGQDFPIARRNISTINNPFLLIEIVLESSKWLLDHHLSEIRALHPDYIIHDAFAYWGKCMAEALDVPAISSNATIAFNRKITAAGPLELFGVIGMLWSGREQFQHSRRLMRGLTQTYQIKAPRILFEVIRTYSSLNIVYTSRLFQPFAETFDEKLFKFVGPSQFQREDAPPFPLEQLGKQPLIYISLGTVYNDRAAFFRTCIEAFADSAYQVVMATGKRVSPEELAPIPANFIVREYVPQAAILERCALFITHGGMNSVSDAFLHHVPMLLVPQSADQPWNARRVVELGAGKLLTNKQVSVASLRRSAREILTQSAYVQAATSVGDSLRLAGGHQRAADEILAFTHAQQRIAS